MVSAREVQELLRFKAETPCLSLYLEMDGQDNWRRQATGLIREAAAKDPLKDLRPDLERVEGFLQDFKPGGRRALAVFSCLREGLWQAFPLPLTAVTSLRLGALDLAPLANILDQHQRYGIALVSAGKARLLEAYLGEIEEPALAPGWTAAPRGRLAADPLHGRLRALAGEMLSWARLRSLDRLILGAPPDLESLLVSHLHTRLQDNLITSPELHAGMSQAEVLASVLVGERESRKVRESVLVHRLFDAVKSGGMGVLGLPETLRALNLGRARMLLVREGLSKMGRVCPCGALATSGKRCAYCWLETAPAFNVIGEMIRSALDQGCEVFQVQHNTRLDAFGGVGAELSFKEEPRSGELQSWLAQSPAQPADPGRAAVP